MTHDLNSTFDTVSHNVLNRMKNFHASCTSHSARICPFCINSPSFCLYHLPQYTRQRNISDHQNNFNMAQHGQCHASREISSMAASTKETPAQLPGPVLDAKEKFGHIIIFLNLIAWESTLSDYGFLAGQKFTLTSKSMLEVEVAKGSQVECNLACHSKAVEDHMKGKLKILNSLVIKQAARKHKAEILA